MPERIEIQAAESWSSTLTSCKYLSLSSCCLDDCPASLLDADADGLDSLSFKTASAAFWAQLSVVFAKVSGFATTLFVPVNLTQ